MVIRKRQRRQETTEPGHPGLMSAPEVGARIGVSAEQARRMMARGLFGPLVDVALTGTRAQWRVNADAVEVFITSRTMARE